MKRFILALLLFAGASLWAQSNTFAHYQIPCKRGVAEVVDSAARILTRCGFDIDNAYPELGSIRATHTEVTGFKKMVIVSIATTGDTLNIRAYEQWVEGSDTTIHKLDLSVVDPVVTALASWARTTAKRIDD